jgi:hypothetical protein
MTQLYCSPVLSKMVGLRYNFAQLRRIRLKSPVLPRKAGLRYRPERASAVRDDKIHIWACAA